MIDLSKYVPKNVSEIKEFKALYDVCSKEIETLIEEANFIFEQIHINSSTLSLKMWEEIFNITPDFNSTIEERKEYLLSHKIGIGTTTKEKIKEVIGIYTNGNCEVIENFSDYSFTIKFTDIKGIPSNMDLVKKTIEAIKPAHLNYDIQYLFNVWNFVINEKKTWNDYASNTWDEIKSY